MLSFLASGLLATAQRLKSGGVIINEHTLSRAATRFHIEVLAKWFDFIHIDELAKRLEQPKTRPFCLVTFDDGKRSNATESAPELESLGVPAVFYVTTDSLTDRIPLWFDRYLALIKLLGRAPTGLEPETVDQLPFALLTERLDRACAKHGVNLDMECDDILPMSWDDARRLASRGFTFGAHGRKHAILTRETRTAALLDIEQSIERVTLELGTPCRSFAFPNGNYTAELAQHAVRCGAKTVMTTEPTWTDRSFPPWRLPRVQLFGDASRGRIELKLALAATGRVLANPDGTGKLYRRINRLDRQQVYW